MPEAKAVINIILDYYSSAVFHEKYGKVLYDYNIIFNYKFDELMVNYYVYYKNGNPARSDLFQMSYKGYTPSIQGYDRKTKDGRILESVIYIN